MTRDEIESHIIAVRAGPGANCSSIGSAVEMLFLSATAGVALVAAVSAALKPNVNDDPAPPEASSVNETPVDPAPPGDAS